MRWALLACVLGVGCAALEPAPYEHAVLEGNLGRRHQLLQATEDGAPVIRIRRDGDVYEVTDILLGKTIQWMVPYDDPKPRLLRFQHTSMTCQAGLLRHGDEAVDLKHGEAALVLKGGGLRKAE